MIRPKTRQTHRASCAIRGSCAASTYSSPSGPIAVTCVTYSGRNTCLTRSRSGGELRALTRQCGMNFLLALGKAYRELEAIAARGIRRPLMKIAELRVVGLMGRRPRALEDRDLVLLRRNDDECGIRTRSNFLREDGGRLAAAVQNTRCYKFPASGSRLTGWGETTTAASY